MIKYKLLFYIINIAAIIVIVFFIFGLFNKYKYTKGDAFISPPYKKTFYSKNNIESPFDFDIYFSKIKNSLHKNKSIKYYKGILHFDETDNMFGKTEFICFYKIGTQKSIMNFEGEELHYVDKTGVIHLSVDLIYKRNIENLLAGEFKLAEDILPVKNSDFEEVNTKKGFFIGYNIKTGDIQYEIKKSKSRYSQK